MNMIAKTSRLDTLETASVDQLRQYQLERLLCSVSNWKT